MKRIKPLILIIVIMMMLFVTGCDKNSDTASPSQATPDSISVPWDNGGKQPKDYTYEEFEALTAEQQLAFQKTFKTQDEFNDWLNKAQWVPVDVPWENGGKKPAEYTWDEFKALSDEQQMAFQSSFEDSNGFEEWYYRVSPKDE